MRRFFSSMHNIFINYTQEMV